MLALWMQWLGVGSAIAAVLGCAYALFAARAVRKFGIGPLPVAATFPGVTMLKPLHGDEPFLYENLASFCDQDYHGPLQILFGVQDPTDPAIAVVHRLMAQWPNRAIELVVSPKPQEVNAKVANLIGLQASIRHEIVVIADSDIGVGRNYLSTTLAALDRPQVGLITCLYRGAAQASVWSRLAAMAIDYHFLPSVLVGVQSGMARPCFGSTIALRRETLAAVGGFEAFVHHLADDYALGEAVRTLGLEVRLSPLIVTHACPERSLGELLAHELRWARTVRTMSPWGYAGSVVTHPLPFALLAAGLTGFSQLSALGIGVLAMTFASRAVLQLQVDGRLRVKMNRWWFGPLRDLLTFMVYIASFFVGVVDWRGRRYSVRADGTLAPIGDSRT